MSQPNRLGTSPKTTSSPRPPEGGRGRFLPVVRGQAGDTPVGVAGRLYPCRMSAMRDFAAAVTNLGDAMLANEPDEALVADLESQAAEAFDRLTEERATAEPRA